MINRHILFLALSLMIVGDSVSAQPEDVKPTVRSGTYEPMTIADQLSVYAAVLGNPARFERISFGDAYAVKSDDFSDEVVLGFAKEIAAGTVSFARKTDSGKFIIESNAYGPSEPIVSDGCSFLSEMPTPTETKKCKSGIHEWLLSSGGESFIVTTNPSMSVGKPLGRVVNWDAKALPTNLTPE